MYDVPLNAPIISREQADHAKPVPDLFSLGSRALGIGSLTGGIATDELQRAPGSPKVALKMLHINTKNALVAFEAAA